MTHTRLLGSFAIAGGIALALAYCVGKSQREEQANDAKSVIDAITDVRREKHGSFNGGTYFWGVERGNLFQTSFTFGIRAVALVGFESELAMKNAIARTKTAPLSFSSLSHIEVECVPVAQGDEIGGPYSVNDKWRTLITIYASVEPTTLMEHLARD